MDLQVITFNKHKIFLIKNFGLLNERKQYIKSLIINKLDFLKNEITSKGLGNNVKVFEDEYFELLYSKFVYTCLKLFKNLEIKNNNLETVWAYLNNKDFFPNEGCIHNHINTAIINSVYYFNVPDASSGKILFFDNNQNEIGSIQPETGDLIIFANYLYHAALQSNSEDYRISLNLELQCNENVLNYFKD